MSSHARQILVTSAIAAVMVIGIGVGLYYTMVVNSTTTTATTTATGVSSDQELKANQTAFATYVSTFTNISNSTRNNTSTSSSEQSVPPSGEYSYSPETPVRILSVQAFANESGSGNATLSFSVEFQNVGNSTIYVGAGAANSLNATILSGPASSGLSRQLKCMIIGEISVGPGQNSTSETPSCGSGYSYVLLHPSTIIVLLTLSWSISNMPKGLTDITAEFTLD